MAWKIKYSLLLLVLFTSCSLLSPAICQENEPVFLGWKCDYTKNNYTQDSPYHSNLLDVFSNLTSLSSLNRFSNFTSGTDEDPTNKVYALYDCRNDLPLRTCHQCVEDASSSLLQRCPSVEAIATYEECMLRYASRPIVSTLELTPRYIDCAVSIPDEGELNRTVEPMFSKLINEATSENSSQYFAVGERKYFEHQRVYSLLQCTPDLSKEQCKECLMEGLNYTLECANNSQVISYYSSPSCQMRYDIVRFFNLSSLAALPPTAASDPPTVSPQLNKATGGAWKSTFGLNQMLIYCCIFSVLV